MSIIILFLLTTLLINQINMSYHFSSYISEGLLQNCKNTIFSYSCQENEEQSSTDFHPSASQLQKIDSIQKFQVPPQKRIKIKRNIKTQIPTSPERQQLLRMKTSPNNTSPSRLNNPLKQRSNNIVRIPSKGKFKLQEMGSINQVYRNKTEHFRGKLSEVLPSPKKHSVPYSIAHKSMVQHNRSASKSEQKNLQKSKKKIHFTVFDERERSKSREINPQKTVQAPPKKQYLVPFRYNSCITIDLFKPEQSQTSAPTRKSSKKSLSKQKSSSSLQRNRSFTRRLKKSQAQIQRDLKIERTMQKLNSYKFVAEYLEKYEIEEQINHYIQTDQPQCKWALLVVDWLFKRIRSEGKFEAYISK